jgi:diguanylate cyclase
VITPANFGNRRILVIDDTPSIHEDFRKILCPDTGGLAALVHAEMALFGDNPDTAPSFLPSFELDFAFQGRDALTMVTGALAADKPYAMAFVDMRMPPGWDGVETIEHLWQVDPRLQIAVCTAYSDYSWEVMSERLDLGDRLLILKKPFDAIEIRQMASALTAKWQLTADAVFKICSLETTIEERALELLKISRLLQYDGLTDLPNGTLLRHRLAQAMAEVGGGLSQVAVLVLGLDRFTRINQALGEITGDALLRSVAGRLVITTGEPESVFRISADQFVILLTGMTHRKQATDLAEQLLAALRMPHFVMGHEINVTASVGISSFPEDDDRAEPLLKKAEVAMHHVKENGRDGFQLFEADMNVRAHEQRLIEEDLRRALTQHQFVLHYQPKVNLRTGAITGAEALIRCRRQDGTFISPAQFIPVAEETGLIVPISRWALHEACQQAQAWRDAGLPPLSMAVNVSALDFRHSGFLETVCLVLQETGLAPQSLELEITEGVLMQDIEATGVALRAIKKIGLRLAIDDFGTGYSSLSYLKRFSVDVLKIDQSFIRDICVDANGAALVRSIINMGKSLDLQVIAEGIETLEQRLFLQANRCDEGQGFYFSPAVPADAFVALLTGGMAHSLSLSIYRPTQAKILANWPPHLT